MNDRSDAHRRGIDRREGLGRRMVRDRRREIVPRPVERRLGPDRRTNPARRAGERREGLG